MKITGLIILYSISGYLSAISYVSDFIFIGPGIIYGLALVISLYFIKRPSLVDSLMLMLLSTVAWFIACFISFFGLLYIFGILSGSVGAYILVTTINRISPLKKIYPAIICGGVLGFISHYLIRSGTGIGDPHNLILLAVGFIIWQIGVGLAIHFSRSRDIQTQTT